MPSAAAIQAASAATIDRFADALWIEEGLAANTLAAYPRRSLSLASTSANRRLTVFRRFFRWAVRERLRDSDPTLKLDAARQPLRVPKSLSEAQVEALLAAPDVDTALGLRDRAMLELLYASGLRVSELVALQTVRVSFSEGTLHVAG